MHACSHFYLRFPETEILKAISSLQKEIPLTELEVKRGQFLLDELPQVERMSKSLLIFYVTETIKLLKDMRMGISNIIRSCCGKIVYFNNLLAFVCSFPLLLYSCIYIYIFELCFFVVCNPSGPG